MQYTKNSDKDTVTANQKASSKKKALITWVGKSLLRYTVLHVAKELCPFANIAELITFIKEYFSDWFD